MDAAIVIVGDEILSGFVRDANTQFIATRLLANGHRLLHGSVVPDDPAVIASEVGRALDGDAHIVFVCGGIGPTHDDRTMEGAARALGRPLAASPTLTRWVEGIVARVRAQGFSDGAWGVESLRRMTMIPDGAEVIESSAGFIPVVTAEDPRGRLVILPGPPAELQAVFSTGVEPRYLAGTATPRVHEEITHRFPESTLAATLAELQERYPATSIGSYPQPGHVLVRIAGPEDEARAAGAEVRARIDALTGSEEGERLLRFLDGRAGERD